MLLTANVIRGQEQNASGRGSIEIGVDSLEQRFFRPRFIYRFNLSSWTLLSDIYLNETMDGDLEGVIDYWINLGLQKTMGKHHIELRLNHMCRHNISIYNPEVLDLNEIYIQYGLSSPGIFLGLALGGYTGGSASYRSILKIKTDMTPIKNLGISFHLTLKWVDWKFLLHEAELTFPLNSASSLFIRNARYYELKPNTFVGIRFSTAPPIESILEAMKLEVGVLPGDDDYKTGVRGDFNLNFFQTPRKRLKLSMGFQALLLKADKFFGEFYPDSMEYRVEMEYETLLKPSLFLSWYNRYYLYTHIDRGIPFQAHLGTGILLKNRRDFDLVENPIGYEVSAGYNFKNHLEGKARMGISLYQKEDFNIQWRTSLYFHKGMISTQIQLMSQWSTTITIRPQLSWGYRQYWEKPGKVDYRFSFGIALLKWFGQPED